MLIIEVQVFSREMGSHKGLLSDYMKLVSEFESVQTKVSKMPKFWHAFV